MRLYVFQQFLFFNFFFLLWSRFIIVCFIFFLFRSYCGHTQNDDVYLFKFLYRLLFLKKEEEIKYGYDWFGLNYLRIKYGSNKIAIDFISFYKCFFLSPLLLFVCLF